MRTHKFKPGDIVQLASGGPHMTIVGHSKDGQAACCWFDKDHKEHRSEYPESALMCTPAGELSEEELKAKVREIIDSQDSQKKPG